ncbi:methyl-accepting chemotaxis protein [Sphingomonas sp.]|uniref:methyl-accepting chemotaxis protein n=1 Tax=Sphingomonas sp. TaxID=28214 RepID=UPI001D8B8B9B|nr:methyl-accepting chemotaxis protein [Sphingomonas sp.]MBX9797770.1 methyl-accepting chemotaxis protein [Sphingomonas sp.]
MLNVSQLSLQTMRQIGTRVMVALMAAGTLATLATGLVLGGAHTLAGTAICAVAMALPVWNLVQGKSDMTARLTLGIAAPLVPAGMLFAMAGHPWQADMHMPFFAVIAALVILCDWRTILAATLVTAVHHLATSFIAPVFVFGGEASLGRVVLHAVIVLVEAGVLMWTANALVALLATSAKALSDAEQAHQKVLAGQETRARVMDEVRAGFEQLAGGDLTVRLNRAFDAEYEPLRHDFNATASQLEAMMGQLASAIASIAATTHEITSAADDLSRRTERQAATLEETAAAATQSSGAVKSVASRAGESEKLFSEVFAEAEAGDVVVNDARRAMEDINKSSQAINSIVGLIDGIAFQTTLLALNAGVEAARSGEAGRGFAVVAIEVRSLAEKAAAAAAEIKGLIATSASQIENGVALVDRAGATVRQIVNRFGDVRHLVGEIAQSTEAQAGALDTVNAAIREIDKVTQSNAAMVEESTAATRSLASDVAGLTELTRQFRFSGAADTGRASRPAYARAA